MRRAIRVYDLLPAKRQEVVASLDGLPVQATLLPWVIWRM